MTFLTPPEDATVTEGGDATFRCEAEENGMALLFGWDIAPVGGTRQTVITGSQVAGVSMVTVSADRTQLTLTEVQREVDGSTVLCSALGSTQDVTSNPATITVQCRYTVMRNRTIDLLHTIINNSLLFNLKSRPSCIQPSPQPTCHCVGRRRLHLLLWI